jgi:hypothetical protein
MQLDILRLGNRPFRKKINKLIELYITKIHLTAEIYKIPFRIYLRKESILEAFVELKKGT